MKILKIFCIIIICFIVLGIVIAIFIPLNHGCTEMACPCESRNGENLTGEYPCNYCGSYYPIFVSEIINLGKVCSEREIIVCENGERSYRYDINTSSCKYQLGSLNLRIFYGRWIFD